MAKVNRDSRGVLLFDCPGCGLLHVVYPQGCESENPARWTWNGSLDAPTLAPSISVRWEQSGEHCHCHSFITNGQIRFCDDSTHALAGQTVEIPEWKD